MCPCYSTKRKRKSLKLQEKIPNYLQNKDNPVDDRLVTKNKKDIVSYQSCRATINLDF